MAGKKPAGGKLTLVKAGAKATKPKVPVKAVKKAVVRKPKVAPAQSKVSEIGIDAVCTRVADGDSLTFIAQDIGVSIGTLLTWVEADPERSARVREARALTARMWDEQATQEIRDATDVFGLSKAKELASHYRWRASKIAPREYGDKIGVEHSGRMQVTQLSDAELMAVAASGASDHAE